MKATIVFLKKIAYPLFFILVFLLVIYITQSFLEVEKRVVFDNPQGEISMILTTTTKPFSFKKILKCYIVKKEESNSLLIFFPVFVADKSKLFSVKWETNTTLFFSYQDGEIYQFSNFQYIKKTDKDLKEVFIRLDSN